MPASRSTPDTPGGALSPPRADVDLLMAFVAVARGGSVGRAAEMLQRTQPTLSARLAGLESLWRTRLFRRTPRGMMLTPEGERLLPRAEAVLREMHELDRAAGLPVAPAGELRLGAGDALGRECLPRALAVLLREQPEIEIHLREGPGPSLLDALQRGEIDLALIVGEADGPSVAGVERSPLLSSEVALLSSRRPPRADRGSGAVRLASLAAARLVTLQPGSGFRDHLERAFRQAGVPFRPAVEVGNLSLVRRFVAAGLGLAPVPSIAFSHRDSLRGVCSRPLRGVPSLTYQRAVRRGVPSTAAAERLIALLRDEDRSAAR
jgi:DNA-binding transcriptional LysR family regulator